MADRVVVNHKPYTGEYPLDLTDEPLTVLEWRWIKKVSGYMPMTIGDGLRGEDPDVFLTLAVVALVRAGKVMERDALAVADQLSRVPVDGSAIQYIVDDTEVPEEETEGEESDPPIKPGPEPRSTGGSGSLTLALSDDAPSPTGRPVSPSSATSDPATSVA